MSSSINPTLQELLASSMQAYSQKASDEANKIVHSYPFLSLADSLDGAKQEEAAVPSAGTTSLPLPPPAKKSNSSPDYMKAVTEALCRIYSSLGASTEEQNTEFTSLQALTLNMENVILLQDNQNIQTETQLYQKTETSEASEKSEKKTNKIITIVFAVLGAVLMLVTIASAIVDFGLSLALVPEEMELEMSDLSATASVETTADETSATTETFTNVARQLGSQTMRRVIGFVGSVMSAVPMAMQAVASIQVSTYESDVAALQSKLASPMGRTAQNGIYLQYYQNLMQRSGNVTSQLGDELGNIIETAGQIMNTNLQASIMVSQSA